MNFTTNSGLNIVYLQIELKLYLVTDLPTVNDINKKVLSNPEAEI